MVFIPFERAQYGDSTGIDDTELLTVLRRAGDAVPIFIQLGKLFESSDRTAIDGQIQKLFCEKKIVVNQRVTRTYTILITFALKVQYIIGKSHENGVNVVFLSVYTAV